MRKSSVFVPLLLGVAACHPKTHPLGVEGQPLAIALLQDATGKQVASARFWEDAQGHLVMRLSAKGLAAGEHGVHIHAVGRCEAAGTPAFGSAGGHYNPRSKEHGLQNPNGSHAGDMPNLVVEANGRGLLDAISARATVRSGPTTLFDDDGSALVIHAARDDGMTDPSGNSGARVACGVIRRP